MPTVAPVATIPKPTIATLTPKPTIATLPPKSPVVNTQEQIDAINKRRREIIERNKQLQNPTAGRFQKTASGKFQRISGYENPEDIVIDRDELLAGYENYVPVQKPKIFTNPNAVVPTPKPKVQFDDTVAGRFKRVNGQLVRLPNT